MELPELNEVFNFESDQLKMITAVPELFLPVVSVLTGSRNDL
jgi:hypothetical protein